MKRSLMVGLMAASMIVSPFAALKQNDKAPDFATKASLAGKEFDFSLKAALAKGPVVVYFYPSAFTGGCNIEAHTFAENKEKFDAAGASIIGVSRDSIVRLNAFSADPQYCAGKIAVASDPDGAIATSYGLNKMNIKTGMKDSRGEEIDHEFTERTTFVITPDLKITATFSTADDKVSPAEHAQKSLAEVQRLASEKSSQN
ncbi:MAG TPA: peroxiredoxin [Vicinamibacterales bacterium]|jgi:peroxiredoxin Q/BCP|nr:peroxiredoxin [Vicinamibacterales bacterium]